MDQKRRTVQISSDYLLKMRRYRTLYAKLTETSQEDEEEGSQGRLHATIHSWHLKGKSHAILNFVFLFVNHQFLVRKHTFWQITQQAL